MRSTLISFKDCAAKKVRTFLVGDDLPIAADAYFGDPGLLGPSSVSWMVLSDPSMLFGGLTALFQQTCHPHVLQGMADHSTFKQDPLGRLRRTVTYVLASTYGSRPEVEEMARRINDVHEHVRGRTADGGQYSADDARLKMWVHCSLVHGMLLAWQAYGPRPLSPSEQDEFVEEQSRVGALLGLSAPLSVDGLLLELASFDADLGYSRATDEAVSFLVSPPVSKPLQAVYSIVLKGSLAILPARHLDVLQMSAKPACRSARVFCKVWRVFIPTNAIVKTAIARTSSLS